jgi:adenylosuccinate lyase
MERTRFLNLSPLDHRYYIANSSLFESLSRFISEEGATRYCIKAEIALVKAHLSFSGEDDPDLFDRLDSTADLICCEEIYAEEEKTQHNIRALVNVLTRHFRGDPPICSPRRHRPITSTRPPRAVRVAKREVVLPLLAV